jgi:CRISPR-associated protein Cmr5
MAQNQTRQQTTQQRRAAHAWANVESLNSASFRNDYGSLVRGLPAMIQTDGLGQSLAFLLAKAKGDRNNAHYRAYNHLEEWLRDKEQFGFQGDLLQWLLKEDSNRYRQVAVEAQAYLGWLKRFAEAKGWKAENDNGG